ncbi:MAG: peptidylprolyl isomerase [Prevotellaceae bacterium]|jgi:peptidyl-prolyl cis-trans isomerase SurA|nr:peptidylprolyl isomerase [Prevotellaceae bacterium]
MKKTLIFLMLLNATCTMAQSNMIDGVVWVVGENSILKSEIEEMIMNAKYEGSTINGDPNCIVPEQIAVQKLFLHQASLDSITTAEGQVETSVNQKINYWITQIGSQEKLEEYFNKNISEIREELRNSTRDQYIIQQVQNKLVGDQKISPTEVRKFYNSLKEDSIPSVPATVEVQILKLEPLVTEVDKEATKNSLRELAERVNSGKADFTMLARLYSEDEGTASQGGDLGFFGKGMMEAEFSNVAFALQEAGKVSRVVETIYGFHIIQLVERKGDRVHCRHILMRPKVSSALKQETINRLDSISELIKTHKITFEQSVARYSSDKETRMNGGLMANQNSGSPKLEYQQLPSEIAKVVSELNNGEVSKPFTMIDRQLGKEVFTIIKVKDKLPSHKANLTDDYQQIKQFCESVKSEEIIQNWIKNKIKETYVHISPEWRNCKFEFEGWIK